MDNGLESREGASTLVFSNFFDMDGERSKDVEYVKGFSRENLQKIETDIERKLSIIARRLGGRYVPPTDEEVEAKFNQTLMANPFVFPYLDEKDGSIWALHSLCPNMKNCTAFNESGIHGVFVFPETGGGTQNAESKIRLYRGARIQIGQPQVAPLARLEGVDVQDLDDYRKGDLSLEDILGKVKDPSVRRYLEYTLGGLRKIMTQNGTTELEELKSLHTCFTPGALDWDLWVAASYTPEETYRIGSKSAGNVYGDFFNLERGYIEGVMILDVPECEVVKYNGEAGIFGQIKPEWVRAVVPQQTSSLKENVAKAEAIIGKKS